MIDSTIGGSSILIILARDGSIKSSIRSPIGVEDKFRGHKLGDGLLPRGFYFAFRLFSVNSGLRILSCVEWAMQQALRT